MKNLIENIEKTIQAKEDVLNQIHKKYNCDVNQYSEKARRRAAMIIRHIGQHRLILAEYKMQEMKAI